MIGKELQDLLLSTGIFKSDEGHLMVFIDESNKPYNVYASWTSNTLGHNQIEIRLCYQTDKKVYIASYKLEDLRVDNLVQELSRFLSSDKRFQKWYQIINRDILIQDIIND